METFLIGSLPFKEVDQALEVAFSLSIPTLPSLPQANKNEFMLDQIQASNDEDLPFLAEKAFFAKLANSSSAFYKWQVCGPYTLAKSAEGFKSDDLANKILATQKRFNLQTAARPLFFLDEPMLGLDPGGSSLDLLEDFLVRLKSSEAFSGAMFGLHCCSEVHAPALAGLGFDLFALDAGLYAANEWTNVQALLGRRLVYVPCASNGSPTSYRPYEERYASASCGQGLSSPEQASEVVKILSSVF